MHPLLRLISILAVLFVASCATAPKAGDIRIPPPPPVRY